MSEIEAPLINFGAPVVITTPVTNGQVLTVSGGKWVNGAATGGVSSVSNADGSLTVTPTTGAVVASLNTAHANTWNGQQIMQKDFIVQTTAPGSGYDNVFTAKYIGASFTAMQVSQSFNFGGGGGDVFYYIPDTNHYIHMVAASGWTFHDTDSMVMDGANFQANVGAGVGSPGNQLFILNNDGSWEIGDATASYDSSTLDHSVGGRLAWNNGSVPSTTLLDDGLGFVQPGVGYKAVDGTAGATATITFYAASTSGGAVTHLNTVTIKNGLITAWTQS